MNASLVTPSGTEITLTKNNGSSNNDIFADTWFDDDAPQPAVGAAYTDGESAPLLAPEEALGNARGEVAAGDWTLRIVDEYTSEDDGTLNGWSLEYATYTGAVPDVTTLHSSAGTTGSQAEGAVGRYTATVTSPLVSTFETAAVHVNLDAATDSDETGATLISPSGSRVTLASENSENYGGGEFLGTTFTDDAGLSNPPGTGDDVEVHNGGTFAPAQPLASLRGENPSGTWTLEVVGEDGPVTVGDWSLDLGVRAAAPRPGSPLRPRRPTW